MAGFAVLTEPFKRQVDRAMAYQRTDRALPVVVLEHPIQNLDAAGTRQRAEALAGIAQRMLRGEEPESGEFA